MRKAILSSILILLSFSIFSQKQEKREDDLYYSPKKRIIKQNASEFTTDIQIVQHNLGKYYSERQTAYGFSLGAVVASGFAIATINNNNKTSNYALIVSGVFSITSAIIFYDSEKWLKRASISISPTSLKINF